MRVFVTGGTGAIGGYAVPAMIAAGHEVRALARTDAAASALRAHGATPVRVSLFDRDGLAESFDHCAAVVNLASALPGTASFVRLSAWTDCHRIRREGSAAVVDAAIAAGVPRVLQESVVMVYTGSGDRWIDEESPVDHYPIATGNHAAEASAHRFTDSGGSGVVLRFGLFYGAGAAHSEQLMSLARRRVGFRAGRPDAYVSSIHLADAAAAVVSALHVDSGTYNIVDDLPVTKRNHTAALAGAVGRHPVVTGPGRAALLLGERTTSLTRSLRVSNKRFRSAGGWQPQYHSVWEGYAQMARRLGGGSS
ncbi:NAD(P)-dependent oxidoreductase [Gordonia terrae]|uniref:NAD-dependent epimerase/dehydratase family protein n=1 Tax=Gordonia terrae TaxID=2055 RepID=UPI00200B6437|nr:NAD(P)-dependent oxidoreductase [Gordonia terrae]UPW08932.1 NAD(P)-dependent oxidoreductase [Gordonia terrae]